MRLTQYLSSLARGWYLLLAGLLVGGLLALLYVQTATPVYTSNTQLFVSTTGTSDVSAAAQGSQLSEERTASYAQLLTGRDLAQSVIDDLGLDMTTGELSSEISAQVLPETVLIDVDVTDASAERAQSIARSVGRQFTELVADLEYPRGVSTPPLQVSVVAAAELPTEPSSPQRVPALAGGLFAGLLLGALAAVARDRLDTTVRDETVAVAASGAPVLGLIPDEDPAREPGHPAAAAAAAEAFRLVRTNLAFVGVDAPPRTIMVTSAGPGEGKTTTSVRLAQALVQSGKRVLLIEADLRRPRAARYLGAIGGAGLTNVLTGSAELEDVLQPLGDQGLTLLAAGPTPPNPAELLASARMRTLLQQVAADYDTVVLDAPPLLPVADAAGLADRVDGVLLCVRWASVPKDHVERAAGLLDRAHARVLGTVLTWVPERALGGYGYGYGYGDDAGDQARPKGRLRRLVSRRRRPSAPPPAAEPALGNVVEEPVDAERLPAAGSRPPVPHP